MAVQKTQQIYIISQASESKHFTIKAMVRDLDERIGEAIASQLFYASSALYPREYLPFLEEMLKAAKTAGYQARLDADLAKFRIVLSWL